MGNLKVPSLSGYAVWYDWTVSHGYVASGFIGMNRNHNKAVQYLSDFRLKPGQITLHSGINNAHPTIRFTVPHSGFYDIEATFFAPGFVLSTSCDATTDAHLSVNNVELRSLWVTRKPGLLMLKQFYLNMGDYVQFEVGWGENKNVRCDTTAANIQIIYLNQTYHNVDLKQQKD